MARKKSAAKSGGTSEVLPNLVQESAAGEPVQNSAGYGSYNAFNLPGQGNGFPGTEQVSNVNTIFKNLRWYLVSNFRQVLSEIYIELGLVQTIVDVPVDDALKGGIKIKSKQLDETQIQELQISLDRDQDIATVGQAAKWNRLFGGAGVIILTDQDPEEPLDLEAIGPDTELEFRAVDMWELFWDLQNTEGYDPSIQTEDFEHYNYYGEKLHKSRVMRLKGLTAPSFIRPRLRGWGFSVVEALVRSINQYLKGTDLGFEVLDEFKLDVYKIKNLVNTLLSPNGKQKIQERVQLANWQKNYQNAIVLDSEDDFDHKQLSFSGLGEAMQGIRMQVASDMRMPMLKLFGTPATGLNASDEESLEVYNSMVESQVRNKIKYDLLRVCEIKCQKLFGFVPDDLSIEFESLRELSSEQEENVKEKKFNRLLAAKQAGEISTLEFRDACNKGNLFDITLDTSQDLLNPDDPEVADIVAEGSNNPDDPQDSDDPGTGRKDTPKGKAGDKSEYGGNKKKKVENEGWDESKHPRADDGKFGKGAGKTKAKKKTKGTTTETPADVEVIPEDIFEPNLTPEQEATARARFRTPDDRKNPATESPAETRDRQDAQEKAMRERAEQPKKITREEAKTKGVAWAKHAAEGDIVEVSIKPSENEPAKTLIGKVDRVILADRDDGDPDKVNYSIVTGDEEGTRYSGTWNMGKTSPWVKIKGVFEKAKKTNSLMVMPREFSVVERFERIMTNSAAFDRASYEADGGDGWIHPGRKHIFDNPLNADRALWAKAKEASKKALGEERWQFVVWFYKKQGGKF